LCEWFHATITSNKPNTVHTMATNIPLLTKRVGLVATGITGYATAVYFTLQFMAKPPADKTESSSHSTSCNCVSSYTTAPDRNDTYQDIAKVYDDQISRDEFVMGLPLLRRSLLYFHAKGNVLEVGAGTGRNLDFYPMKDVSNVVLTDLSDKMLLQAREKIMEKKKKNSINNLFKVFVADAMNITNYYKEDVFDTIVSTFTLCSFDNPVEVLRELQSVCKPDGKILLLEHGRSKSWDGLSNYLDNYAERHAKNWGCVWNRDLDDILEKAGLEIESIHTWHFGTTYYVVCRPSSKVKDERKRLKAIKIQQEQKNQHEQEMMGSTSGTLNSQTGVNQWKKFFFMSSWKKES
jgi:methyltransferase OMS1